MLWQRRAGAFCYAEGGRSMKAITKITFLDENGEKFFGEGPARLMRGIEEKHLS